MWYLCLYVIFYDGICNSDLYKLPAVRPICGVGEEGMSDMWILWLHEKNLQKSDTKWKQHVFALFIAFPGNIADWWVKDTSYIGCIIINLTSLSCNIQRLTSNGSYILEGGQRVALLVAGEYMCVWASQIYFWVTVNLLQNFCQLSDSNRCLDTR
jgi:hypothetical protein